MASANHAPGRQATRTRIWPFIALAILAAAAAQPLANAWLACTDDAPFHLYRAVELGSLIALGHLFPRWAPHMALGYGYPFFNFYAPFSSYAVVLLHFAGLAYPAALKLAFALGLWLAGIGAFLFVADLWGVAAGLAAGAAYIFAPYLAYDVLFRGNLAESLAFIWPPLVLWGLTRLSRVESSPGLSDPASPGTSSPWIGLRRVAFVALTYAGLVLTHNIFAFIASPLFAGYAALLAWQGRSGRVLIRAALALAAGAALTAYFWVPAIAERDLVHWDRLFVAPIFTWNTNFISPAELLAPPHAEDPLLINPSPARAIGLLPALLCLPALAAAVIGVRRGLLPDQTLRVLKTHRVYAPRIGRNSHVAVLFFSLALLGYCFLSLAASAPVWRLISPLALVQFPWRMLGPAALCAAVLIGAGVAAVSAALEGRVAARWAAAVPVMLAVGLIYFGNLGWWYPRYCPSSPTASVADLVGFELSSNTIGTTAKGEYIPRTAGGVPADQSLARALTVGVEPSRLSLPAGASTATAAARDPLDATYQVMAATVVSATYQQFYFPGWAVTIDGQPVAAQPAPDTGLIRLQLPAGTHAVRIYFGETPLRTAAIAMSIIAALSLAALISMSYVRRPAGGLRQARAGSAALPTAPAPLLMLGLCLALPLIKLTLVDRLPNPLRRTAFDPAAIAPVAGGRLGQHALAADFAGSMRLFGYDLSATQLPGDGAFDVALYVARTTASGQRYWPIFTVEDAAGLAWHDPEMLPPRWQREPPGTPLWPLDQYAQWARHLNLLPGTPPGAYQLWGQVFDLDGQQIASVLDAAGNATAPRFGLGTLAVTRPSRPFTLDPPKALFHDFGPVALLGYDIDRAAANAGDSLHLSLFWRSQAATSADDTVVVSFVGADHQPAFRVDTAPANGYPTSQWRPGDEWRGQSLVRLPAALPSGAYTLTVELKGAGAGPAALGTVHVSVPARSFDRPAIALTSGAEFGGVGVLEGYSLSRTTQSLLVNLVWRATASPANSYSVFVHLEGQAGRIWAQSDAAPANWSRPTTGWVTGEYVLDSHSLQLPPDLPAGAYTLWAGLYDPLNGARVRPSGPGAAADQRVAIGQVSLP